MATTRPFSYNTGSLIEGTDQIDNLAIGTSEQDYSLNPGGVTWWNGPDEELGYVIAYEVPLDNHPTPLPDDNLTLSMTYSGWDIGLSNGGQTANQAYGYQQTVLGNTLISGQDKIMFSIKCILSDPSTLIGSHLIGFGTILMNYKSIPQFGAYPGNDNQSMGFSAEGKFYYNGAIQATGLPTWGHGDTIDIAIDRNSSLLWIRVNGGNWNNSVSESPGGSSSQGAAGLNNLYPALCPGYAGTMIVMNTPTYGVPAGFNFLGKTTASVGFKRSAAKDQTSFVNLVNLIYNQSFTTGNDAMAWLNNNGYWTSWDGFGSSGFQWMNISSITSTTASGSGQNGITVAITQSNGGMGTENGMYSPTTFPPEYGVPLSGNQIRNTSSGVFTATFSEPVTNPLVAFASVGNPGLYVPVQSTAPFTPIWSTSTTYQNAVNGTQYTQFTGNEGFNIIRIDGTLSSVSFTYSVTEFYCTVCFGFVDQNV